jgi:tetratricopeptide (TPR) repeat protein
MLGLSAGQIRAYATKGFVKPERGPRGELRFGFQDLVILRTANELHTARIPERKVRRVLERVRDQLPAGRSLAAVRIAADGERVVVRDGDAVFEPESGQALFDFSVAEIAEKSAPLARRNARIAEQKDLTAEEWYDLGCEVEPIDADEARTAYQRALELDPNLSDAHVNLGRLLHEDDAPAAAEKHYRRALEIDPENETAAFNLGVALDDLGRLREAIVAYRRALELDPNNVDAHYNLAGIYERRGEKAAALRHLAIYRRLRS